MTQITKDNFYEFGETLNSLPWWEFCHDILSYGSSDEKADCCVDLKDMPTIKRNTAFKQGFNLGQWVRETIHG